MTTGADVLAVDDQAPNLRLIERALAPLGYRVRTATSGEEALDAVRALPPDVILLDVMLPGISGFDVCRILKEDESTRFIPVLLVTALSSSADRRQGIEAGCDEFITKPVDVVELQTRVRTLMRLGYAALQRREAEVLNRAVEGIDDGLVVTDDDGSVLLANRRACALLDLSEGEVAGRSFWKLLAGRYQVHGSSSWQAFRGVGGGRLTAVRSETAAQPSLWLDVTLSRVAGQADEVGGRCICTLRDSTQAVTDRRVHAAFLDVISHKLRTPLTVTLGSSELVCRRLRQPAADPRALVALADAARNRLGELAQRVNDALRYVEQLSRPTLRGSTGMDELAPIVGRLREAFDGVSVDVAGDFPGAAAVSPAAMELILSEIVANAVKFHATHRPRITVDLAEELGGLRLKISDDGLGVPAEQQGAVWLAFQQLERDFTGNTPGWGLGLTAVAELVWQVGGAVAAFTPPGGGFGIELRLPRG